MAHVLTFQALLVICATAAFLASLQFIRRLVELRQERLRFKPDAALQERLAQIETTVEATALEVERISEASRFMAKLLADRSVAPGPGNRPEPVITPH